MVLKRDLHLAWLKKGLVSLPPNFCGLDASRPWFVFWISHAMEVLGDFEEQHWSPQVEENMETPWYMIHPYITLHYIALHYIT